MSGVTYDRLTRLARNLREGDELWLHDESGPRRISGRVRVLKVRKADRGYFTGQRRVELDIERACDAFVGRPWPGTSLFLYSNDVVALWRPRVVS